MLYDKKLPSLKDKIIADHKEAMKEVKTPKKSEVEKIKKTKKNEKK